MIVYHTKHAALEAALSDEVVVKVEAGYVIIPKVKYRKWKRR